ncbi:amino acid permease [Haloparvum sp. AD34]
MVEHTRSLGFRVAYAMGLGTMIAAGIFSLSGVAVARIGSSAVIAFMIAALVAGITAASYSEFASIYAENGGGYLFSSRTFDSDALTYFVGASLFLGYTGTTAFYLATMGEWWQRFIFPEGWPIPHGTTPILIGVLLGALNARGTEESGTFQVIVTSAKVAVLFAFIGGAFSYAGPVAATEKFAMGFQVEPVGIISVAALAFITFFGFSAIAASAGEIIEPRKTVPKAIALSILTVVVLYTFVIIAMVNSPIPAEVVAKLGETAMGHVAAAFLGPIGRSLIVAGAIFSMVSASNASILAASGIGSLMGKRGQAPRSFQRIHPEFGTPFWSVATATATIVALILAFSGVVPSVQFAGLDLHFHLSALTGFATFNLLVPLSVVNVALIYSRRRYPDIDRPFSVPLVPLVPALGVVANVGLIGNLPVSGILSGVVVVLALMASYFVWGGEPESEALFKQVTEARPHEPTATEPGDLGARSGETLQASGERATTEAETEREEAEEFRVLVPVARPSRAPAYVRLASDVAETRSDQGDPVVQVVTITQLPEQTPFETLEDTAGDRAAALEEELADVETAVDYTVEGHICRDVAFDILQTARDDGADLILMGYPEAHQEIATEVQFKSPCDVLYASGLPAEPSLDVINVGAGGGPHHHGLLPLINDLGEHGSTIHVIRVTPTGEHGTREAIEETLDSLSANVEFEVHDVEADMVADGLVDTAAENGGLLFLGATRTRELKRWVLGSTPDRVIDRASEADLPVIVYASSTGVVGRLTEYLFPVYRYFVKLKR